jgi:hypothetical protein
MPMSPVDQFNEGVDRLLRDSNSLLLERALLARPRMTPDVADAINHLRQHMFMVDDVKKLVDVIKSSGTTDGVDPTVLARIDICERARELYELYARIHGVSIVQPEEGLAWMDWATNLESDYDTITVPTPDATLEEQDQKDVEDDKIEPQVDAPLCMTCGTKMRPAGSFYVCEGCGSTQNMPA